MAETVNAVATTKTNSRELHIGSIVNDRYKVTKPNFARGGFGAISEAIDLKTCPSGLNPSRDDIVALKYASFHPFKNTDPQFGKYIGFNGINFSIIRELRIVGELNHKNLMGIRDIFTNGNDVVTVMDFMDGGDLDKYLYKNGRTLNESQKKCLMQGILRGLDALHKWNFIHRDLSAGNVFLSKNGDVKVGDFGLSRRCNSTRPMTQQTVTIWYRAPEILYGAKHYGTAADIWSAGCLLAMMINNGTPLFARMSEEDMLSIIFAFLGTPDAKNDWVGVDRLPHYKQYEFKEPQMRNQFPNVNKNCMDLLLKMLSLNPANRPSAEECLNHPWFSQYPYPCDPKMLFM